MSERRKGQGLSSLLRQEHVPSTVPDWRKAHSNSKLQFYKMYLHLPILATPIIYYCTILACIAPLSVLLISRGCSC